MNHSQCARCGGEHFIEERIIALAAAPSADPRRASTARQVFYRLRCANCNTLKTNPIPTNGNQKPNRKTKRDDAG